MESIMAKTAIRYGLLLAGALISLKLLEYSYLSKDITLSFYIGTIAVAFLGVGVYFGTKFFGAKMFQRRMSQPLPYLNHPKILG